jgi:hypothetical protein
MSSSSTSSAVASAQAQVQAAAAAAAAAGISVNGGGAGGGANGAWQPTNVGEQMDMNVLWELVSNLAEVHQGIREQTQGVLQRVQMIQSRGLDGPRDAAGASPGGGESPSTPFVQEQRVLTRFKASAESQLAELSTLRGQLHVTESRAAQLQSRNSATWALLAEHEAALSALVEKLRPFVSRHESALHAQKARYLALLGQERTANLDLRLEIARLQEGLGRALGAARAALDAQEARERPWRRRVAALSAENKVLAAICGVAPMEFVDEDGASASSGEDEMVHRRRG